MNRVEQPKSQLTLEKATLDLRTTQVQMIVGIVLAVVACFVAYAPTLNVGFLLDDFLHLDYVARAAHGDWGDFVHNFYGNWAGSDIMKCYRPISSTSFFVDYLIWGANAFGFHLTNIILLSLCTLFVGLITLEMTGPYGNRIGAVAAIWAGLLFAVYPLHPEATAWAIGRVDLLCGVFYFASVFCYMRFRLLHEKGYFFASLACFLLSFASKEMAVSLPIVIALYELLMIRSRTSTVLNRFMFVGSFFVVLAICSIARTLLLSTVIGGYETLGTDSLMNIIGVFLDKATLLKLLIPVNEEVSIASWLILTLWISYALVALLFVARLITRAASVRPFLFLLAWAIILVLPTFQVWHIHPNLVGSRLFFLSSAPFCMFFALAALPAVDVLNRKTAKVLTFTGAVLLSVIFLSWGVLLSANIEPWVKAGQLMAGLRSQVWKLAAEAPAGNRVLLLDIPRDYSGAGMLTRPQYLAFMAGRPVSPQDYSNKLITIEPVISGSHDFMWPRQFKSMINNPEITNTLIWSSTNGSFVPWSKTQKGLDSYKFDFVAHGIQGVTLDPADTLVADGKSWHMMSTETPCIEKNGDFVRVYPASRGLTLWLPVKDIDSVKANVVVADINKEDAAGCSACLGGKVSLVWQVAGDDKLHQAPIMHGRRGQYVLWVGRYRSWTLGKITRVGLWFQPGDYHVDLKSLEIGGDAASVPKLVLTQPGDVLSAWMHDVKLSEKLQLTYDVSAVKNAKWVKLFVTKPGVTVDANGEAEIDAYMPLSAQLPMNDWEIHSVKGVFDLPAEVLESKGVHQIRAIALDANGAMIGFPSEPITIKIGE